MADAINTDERAAFYAWIRTHEEDVGALDDASAWAGFVGGRASLAANAGSPEINGQLYTALNNLFTHLGMEGCITADHAFVWDAMTALKRIDGGVHLDNLAVPVDPDAHRDDMLAAVQLLEGGEWAEHFAKTPIGMRLEDQITKWHNEVAANAGSEPVAWCQPDDSNAAEAFSWPGTDKRPHHTTPLYTHTSPPEGMAGWRLVPVKPTAAMCKAAADAWLDCGSRLVLNKAGAAVAAGIAAAPPLPASEAKEL